MGSLSSFNERNVNFNNFYELGKQIGVGSFATVNKCYRKHDSAEFAVKIINKSFISYKESIALRNEILILKKISHENIVKLIDVFDDGKCVFLILEMCNDTNLFDEIKKKSSKQKHFSERNAAQIMYSLSKALQHLHKNGVVHRDVKPQNILFGSNGTIKISDFGLARFYQQLPATVSSYDSILLHTTCGTPRYVAPEILSNEDGYDRKCDVWSMGVILYLLLVGYQPFKADSVYEIYKLIVKGKYNFDSAGWNDISDGAKNLVTCLLQVDPTKRYSAKDIEYHPWIMKNIDLEDIDIDINSMYDCGDNC